MKRRDVFALNMLLVAALVVGAVVSARAQAKVATVEISPNPTEAVAGQKMKFTATARDDAGKTLDLKPSLWVAF